MVNPNINRQRIPVIDIFAGPGGLSEGFSSVETDTNQRSFKIVLSIEKEYFSYQTLKLRAFYREFEKDNIPMEYYKHLQGNLTLENLYAKYPKESQAADAIAWRATLGSGNSNEVDNKIQQAIGENDNWVLIGGPPCQAYSIAGRSRKSKIWRENPLEKENDEKHFLYREYLRILEVHNPPVFVMENVRGMLSSSVSEGKIADLIFHDLDTLNYRLYSCSSEKYFGKDYFSIDDYDLREFVIKSEEFGIPQKRHRVIILGIRDDIEVVPDILTKDPQSITTMQCIGDLPKLRSGLSKEVDSNKTWRMAIKNFKENGLLSDLGVDIDVREEIYKVINKLNRSLNRGEEFIITESPELPKFKPEWFVDTRLNGVCNHSTRGHIRNDLYRYLFASCYAKINQKSPKLMDFPEMLLPNHENVQDGVNGKVFSDRFRVQLSEQPATTITSHISKDGHYFIHPDPEQCRSFTVREAARIQTFPDNYSFVGPRTAQYVQVGNAVPPLLAKQIAKIVINVLWQID